MLRAHLDTAVIEASSLFVYAEEQGIAYYNEIQDIIYRPDPAVEYEHNRRHRNWHRSCFIVGADDFESYWQEDRTDWDPRVEAMVRRYMAEHDLRTLVIATQKDAYLLEPLFLSDEDESLEKDASPEGNLPK